MSHSIGDQLGRRVRLRGEAPAPCFPGSDLTLSFEDRYCQAVCVAAGQLRKGCQQSMASFQIPQAWYRVEVFPMNSSRKILKVALREQAAARALDVLS